jgi:predicted Zn-dependent protease
VDEAADKAFADALLDHGDLNLLAEICYIALSRGILPQARAMLDALVRLRPRAEVTLVGEAMFWLTLNEPRLAVDKLRNGPPSDSVRAFLGYAMMHSGEAEAGARILQEVAAKARVPACRTLAATFLEERAKAAKDPSYALFAALDRKSPAQGAKISFN